MRYQATHTVGLPLAAAVACLFGLQYAQAERFNDSLEPNDSNWSTPGNWVGGLIADDNTKTAELAFGDPVVDTNYTVRELRTIFSTTEALVSGPGTLTVDRNASTTTLGLLNGSGQGAVLAFDGSLTIDNSLEGRTVVRNANSASNVIRFGSTSALNLQTGLEIQNGVGGTVEFNGSLAGSGDLFFNSTNATFGAAADNTGYEGDLVFFSNALAVSNLVGGTLVESEGKVQVNGTGGRIEINGPETFFGSVSVSGANDFSFDANADQSSIGVLGIADGELTLDVDAVVMELAFADSSEVEWGAGSVSIVGYKEDTIRFGTDANGLTAAQLAAIDDGIYSLSSQGYLTAEDEPSLSADFNGDGTVDLLDLDILGSNFNVDPPTNGDANGDGSVDLLDLDLLGSQFGMSVSASASVPEPTAALLALCAAHLTLVAKRRAS